MSSTKAHLKSAREAINQQDFDSALESCESALSIDSENYTGWIFKGLALCKLGRTQDSVEAYEKAMSIDPISPLGYQVAPH